jgi:hypothetical protein
MGTIALESDILVVTQFVHENNVTNHITLSFIFLLFYIRSDLSMHYSATYTPDKYHHIIFV